MKTLWFKARYVDPILTGQKTHTIRARAPKLGVGEIIDVSVGPRTPFARVKILDISTVDLCALPVEEQRSIADLYPGVTALAKLDFQLIS